MRKIFLSFVLFILVASFSFAQEWQYTTSEDMMNNEQIEVMHLVAKDYRNSYQPPVFYVNYYPSDDTFSVYIIWGGSSVDFEVNSVKTRIGEGQQRFSIEVSKDREAIFFIDIERIFVQLVENDELVAQVEKLGDAPMVARWDMSSFKEAVKQLITK